MQRVGIGEGRERTTRIADTKGIHTCCNVAMLISSESLNLSSHLISPPFSFFQLTYHPLSTPHFISYLLPTKSVDEFQSISSYHIIYLSTHLISHRTETDRSHRSTYIEGKQDHTVSLFVFVRSIVRFRIPCFSLFLLCPATLSFPLNDRSELGRVFAAVMAIHGKPCMHA